MELLSFEPGRRYSRADVKELAGLSRDAKGGPWDTGIVEHNGEFVIFANVGTEGRTGHDYDNRWLGGFLRWCHRRGSNLDWPSVRRLLDEEAVIHLFWRDSNESPFEYSGVAKAIEVFASSPVGVLWSFTDAASQPKYFSGSDELGLREYREGSARRTWSSVFERDPAARQACIDHYGHSCVVCGLVFEERYGSVFLAQDTSMSITSCPCLKLAGITKSTPSKICAPFVLTVTRWSTSEILHSQSMSSPRALV